MALPNQFKSARMSNATDRATIDNHVGDLEQMVCDAFGITIDQNISAAILGSVDSSGRITGKPRLYGAGNAAGIRFRDSGTSKEFLIACASSALVVYENTGTEETPVWTQRWSLTLATGLTTQAVLPICRVTRTAVQSIPNTTNTPVEWTTEVNDPSDWHDVGVNPSRITVDAAGMYSLAATVNFDNAVAGICWAAVYLNGGGPIAESGIHLIDSVQTTGFQVCCQTNMAANQYLEVAVYQSSGGALDIQPVMYCQVARISG